MLANFLAVIRYGFSDVLFCVLREDAMRFNELFAFVGVVLLAIVVVINFDHILMFLMWFAIYGGIAMTVIFLIAFSRVLFLDCIKARRRKLVP